MTELQNESVTETEVDLVWSAAPVSLNLSNDVSFRGLVSAFRLPGDDVHPAVMAAAIAVQAAETERARQQAELDARAPAREQLKQELIQDGRTVGPARQQAAQVLAQFDAETELVQALLPDADRAVESARVELAAAVYAAAASWNQYLDREGRKEAEALEQALQPVLGHLHRLVRLDALKAREQIIQQPVTTGAEWQKANARGERVRSIEQIIGGGAVGAQGHQLSGLIGLLAAWRDVFAEPEPQPEIEIDPNPPAVRFRLENPGIGAGSAEINTASGDN